MCGRDAGAGGGGGGGQQAQGSAGRQGQQAHPWGGVSPFKMHYSIAFKHQFIIGRPPLGEILYPPLGGGGGGGNLPPQL